MFVWIKKSQKKRWFKQRRNLRRKIKYQISCCIRGLFSPPPNMPGKRVTLLGGKNIHELQLQRKESSVANEADEKQSGAKRTTHRAALKKVSSVPVFWVACYIYTPVRKYSLSSKTDQSDSRFWTVLVNCAASRFGIPNIYHYSPQSVFGMNMSNTYSHIYLQAG